MRQTDAIKPVQRIFIAGSPFDEAFKLRDNLSLQGEQLACCVILAPARRGLNCTKGKVDRLAISQRYRGNATRPIQCSGLNGA